MCNKVHIFPGFTNMIFDFCSRNFSKAKKSCTILLQKMAKPKSKPQKQSKQCPEGHQRLQFLNKLQNSINNNSTIKNSLAHKLNLNYASIANMVTEKYLLKIEPARKKLFCKRCKGMFSCGRENYQVEVKNNSGSLSKHASDLLLTKCKLCGYVKPKVIRHHEKIGQNGGEKNRRSTNFKDVTS